MMTRSDQRFWFVLGALLLVAVGGQLVIALTIGRGFGPWWFGPSPFAGGDWLWGVGFGLAWLFRIAIWVALIALVVLLVRRLLVPRGADRRWSPESAADVLRRRYAAGEITREQYEEMRQVIGPSP